MVKTALTYLAGIVSSFSSNIIVVLIRIKRNISEEYRNKYFQKSERII